MKIKNIKYLLISLVLLMFLIGAASAADDAVTLEGDAAAVDSISEDASAPITTTVSEDASIGTTFSDSAIESDSIQSNDDLELKNVTDVKQKDSSDALKDGESTTIFVSTGGNDNNDGLSLETAVATVEKAINITKTGGTDFTLLISNGDYNIEQITIPVGKYISIIGESKEGTILHASGDYGFDISYGCNFENLTISDLNSTSSTSAAIRIIMDNYDININNCIFKNIGSAYGAVHVYSNGKTSISNVLIEDCFATKSDDSSIIHVSGKGPVSLDNVEIRGSYMLPPAFPWSTPYLGAIIFLSSADPDVTLMNSRIHDNNGSIYSIITSKGKIKIINTTISDNCLNASYASIFSSGVNSNTATDITVTQSVIADNILANNAVGLLDARFGVFKVDHNIIINNKNANGNDLSVGDLSGASSFSIDDNYWGTNVRPNDKTSEWVILTGDVAECAFVGVCENIKIFLNSYVTESGEIGVIDGMPTVELAVGYALNQENPSAVTIKDGVGTISYLASIAGEETLILSTGDVFEFNVSSEIGSLIFVDGSVETSGDGTQENPVKTIAEALNIAADGKIILIKNGTYKESNLLVDKDITIKPYDGADVIIDGDNQDRIFTVTSTATISDLSLTGGNATGDGGAIYLNGGNLTLSFLNISNCIASDNGGAIATAAGSDLYLSNSIFTDNFASKGQSIFIGGEAEILMNDFVAHMDVLSPDASFNAISINTDSPVSIVSNNFNDNGAIKGQAVYIKDAPVSLSGNIMDDEIIYLESGSVNSNLIFMDGKTLTVEPGADVNLTATLTDDKGNLIRGGELTFTANGVAVGDPIDISGDNELRIPYTLPSDSEGDIIISGSYSFDNGGTIVNGTIEPDIPYWFIEGGRGYKTLNETVENAVAGDVIYGSPGTYIANGIFITKDLTIKANETGDIILDGNGSRVFTIKNQATLSLVNLDLSNGGSEGGGFVYIYAEGGNLNVINSTLRDLNIVGYPESFEGGAIKTYASSTINIESSHFENINSSAFAPILSGLGGVKLSLTIKDSSFTDIKGTAMYGLMNAPGKVNIERSNFTGIIGNTTKQTGLIFADSTSNYLINECLFSNISTDSVIRFKNNGNITVTKSVFQNIQDTGGALYIYNPGSAKVNYNLFIDNTNLNADSNRDIYSYGSNVDLSYNFWGNNSKPTESQIYDVSKAPYWTIEELSMNSDYIFTDETADIAVQFVGTDGEENLTLDDVMPEYSFNLEATNGTLDANTVTLVDNEAIVTFTPPSLTGTVTVTATPGPAELTFDVIETSKLLVVSTAGSDENAGSFESPYRTIAYALTKANETRNIIYLIYTGEDYKEHDLTLAGNLTIMGENDEVTINATIGRIFLVTGNVSIKSLTLSNGFDQDYGGAIYVDGGNLTLDYVNFNSNRAYGLGGAIATSSESNLYISNSIFTDNFASFFGGAIGTASGSNLSIDNCIFSDNKASYGGAIYLAGESLILTSTFDGNHILLDDGRGGAIYVNTTDSVVISSNEFENNFAYTGEVIYIENGIVTLSENTIDGDTIYLAGGSVNSNLVFMDNSTLKVELGETVNLTASLSDDCGNPIRGGSIIFTVNGEAIGDPIDISGDNELKTTYTVPIDASEDMIISGSYSLDNGGIVKAGSLHPSVPHWFIEGGIGYEYLSEAIDGAEAGDVIYYDLPEDYTDVISSKTINKALTIKNNGTNIVTLDGDGNNVFTVSADLDLINLNFVNGGNTKGGFISQSSNNLNIINSSFKNSASSSSAAAILSSNGNLNIESCLFENISSSASSNGGIICYSGSSGNLNINNSAFNNLSGKYDGFIIYSSTFTNIANSNFTNLLGPTSSGYWGGIYNSKSLNLTNCQFINVTGPKGAAIYSTGSLNVTRSVFENIITTNSVIYSYSSDSFINYNIFADNNKAIDSTRANADYNFWGSNDRPSSDIVSSSIYHDWVIVELSSSNDTIFLGSTEDISIGFLATDGEENSTLEDAMPSYGFELTVTDGTIEPSLVILEDNEAKAVYTPSAVGTVTITASPGSAELELNVMDKSTMLIVSAEGSDEGDGSFESPYATIAHALSQVTETRNIIYILSSDKAYKESGLVLSGNVIIMGEDNSVTINGGNESRIFLVTGNASISDLILSEGMADDYGGAIYVDGGSLALNNVIISQSKASLGGAIYINTSSDVSISSNVFEDNEAEKGEAIYIENGALTLTENAMGNETVYLAGGSVNSNLVFLANSTLNAEFGKNMTITATLTDDCGNVIRGGAVVLTVDGETIGTVDLSGSDPLEIDFYVPQDASEDMLVSGSYSFDNGGTVSTGAIHPCIFYWIIEEGRYGFETLDEAIDASRDNDVIYYDLPDDYEEILNDKVISHNLVIKNNGTGIVTLDADRRRMFDLSGDLELNNLVFINGATNKDGGFIYQNSGSLNIISSIFKDSLSSYSGVVVFSNGGDISIDGSRFENLTSRKGPIDFESNSGRVDIRNSVFDHITGNYDGFVIYCKSDLNIEDCNFTNLNSTRATSTNYYGAICHESGSGDLNISGSYFSNIYGPTGTAVYYKGSGTYNISKNIFENISSGANTCIIYGGSSGNINYNVFLDINCGITTSGGNIDYNYWGTNDYAGLGINGTVPNNWIIMNVVANDSDVIAENEVPITVDFNHYIENGEIKELEDSLAKEFTVQFTSSTSELDVDEVNTTDQVAIAFCTAVVGENNITVKSDNAVVEITFNASEPLESHMSVDMDDDNNLIVTITDGEGNGIEGKTVCLFIGDEVLNATTDSEGNAVIALDEVDDGAYTAKISFKDPEYKDINENTFVVIRTNELIEPVAANISIELSIEDGKVIANVTDLDGVPLAEKLLTVSIDGVPVLGAKTDENGIYSIDVSPNATVTVSCSDVNGAVASASITYVENNNTEEVVVIEPVSANITIVLLVAEGNVVAYVTDLDDVPLVEKLLSVSINDIPILGAKTDEKGIWSLPIEANSTIVVSCSDVNGAVASASITYVENNNTEVVVEPVSANIVIGLSIVDGKVIANVTDLDGNTLADKLLSVSIDGVPVLGAKTDENGIWSIDAEANSTVAVSCSDANGAVASASIAYIENNKTEEIIVPVPVPVPVVANATISLSTEDGKSIIANLKDLDGKAIANATLNAKVNGIEQNLTTDANGIATIPVSANTTVEVSYTDSNMATVTSSMSLTVIETIVEINKTIVVPPIRNASQIVCSDMNTISVAQEDGRVGEYFNVKLVDANGKPLANKFIQIGFNGRVYDRTTDENGSTKLQINLAYKGTYTFAIAYLGDDNYNGSFVVSKIKVTQQTPSLKTSSKTYKTSAKTKALTATFKTVGGKPISGKTVKFTVNGKTYSGKTNAKGVATVNVSLNKKGTYSFTVKYAGDDIFKAVSASGKLTLK
ncbi:adhesin-like protein [Methanobrevibacter ruminantium M1]|uniref:Adhesin-like protein n=1 Tax=Methanobrevibacter ruminantium (strain ATCC 35063 / DSM 1093 / JCM 13430 / OCM 146 / M1) TaxID=634498 RepID=D3DYL8_METRM|nr:Ig-like domain repeat protein [Methanobrevibacter ruminantium]ADC45938.1 adhesin-like protein [Methanobrevibacter ruminantium M1]